MESSKSEIPVITGPTAVGKTQLSLILAAKLNGEIINMDSRQVYRRMDIGTAKPSKQELEQVPHHLIDIVDPGERYTVGDFVEDCRKAIDDIKGRGRVPIIAGGTPFYLSALLGKLDFCNVDADMELREQLKERAERYGNEALHEELKRVDPVSAENIHPNDVYRVVRALEIFHVSGKQASQLRGQNVVDPQSRESDDNIFHIHILYREREKLYHLINLRTAEMYNKGLVEETKSIMDVGKDVSSFLRMTIGYAQALEVVKGKIDQVAAQEETSKQTRRFAKRQIAWFRAMDGVHWHDRDNLADEEMAETIMAGLNY